MNSALSFQYPVWFILFCLALGAIYAGVLYYNNKSFKADAERGEWWQRALAAFRFLVVSLLAILLLSPFLKSRETQTLKPIVALVQDNSESVRSGLKKDTALYREKMKALRSALEKKYEVLEFSAGDALRNGIDFSFNDKSSNLSGAFEEITNLFYNRNLGAVVLSSDGIYNKGINPVYTVSKSNFSIYTISLGDTTIQRDQKIANVYFNRIVYLNDNFNLKTDIEANNLSGKNTRLSIYEIGNESRLLQQKEIQYTTSGFFQTYDFIIPAQKIGVAHYRIVLSNLDGEISYKNNVRDIFVEVLDGRQKILVIANSAHPDLSALKSSIETNKNYQVDVEYAATYSKQVKDYNLVVLHQLPSANQKIQNVFREMRDLNKSVLFVLGSQTSVPDFVKVQNAVSLRANSDKFNEVTCAVDKNFPHFSLSDKSLETLRKLPPLTNFFGEYLSNPSSQVLAFQKINTVQTDFPLWLFNETSESKVGVICGEGIWRWRLHDFLINKNHDATNELINKTVQYLCVKSDKRPFKVNTAKAIYQDNEAVVFDAQLYNANYELINQGDVVMKVSGADGKTYDYTFNKTENAYRLNAGFFPVGNYSYKATAKVGNGSLTAAGKFSISPLQLEEMRTRADHQVLFQLSSQHNGSMHNWQDAEKIAVELDAKNSMKPILYDSNQTQNVMNFKWIFFLLLVLLACEWGIRKYLGGY